MTEAEARENRCCGPEGCGRVLRTDPVYNQADTECVGFTTVRLCIGSACMAWRVLEAMHPDDAAALGSEGIPYGTPIRMQKVGGYCGLAGRP